jgi:hypothetical protein
VTRGDWLLAGALVTVALLTRLVARQQEGDPSNRATALPVRALAGNACDAAHQLFSGPARSDLIAETAEELMTLGSNSECDFRRSRPLGAGL